MSNVTHRFHIIVGGLLKESAAKWHEARAQAKWRANDACHYEETIEIFDSMARVGRPELWKLVGEEPVRVRIKAKGATK
jgi:hypothetical protein